jgi:hypothetical protein
MKTDKIKIQLTYHDKGIVDPYYQITKLVNAASITPELNWSRSRIIGDTVNQDEANALATDRRFEVTIVKGN